MRRLPRALDAKEDTVDANDEDHDHKEDKQDPPHLHQRLEPHVQHHELSDRDHSYAEGDYHLYGEVQRRVGHVVSGTRDHGVAGHLVVGEERDVHRYPVADRSRGARNREEGVEDGDGLDARGRCLPVEVV